MNDEVGTIIQRRGKVLTFMIQGDDVPLTLGLRIYTELDALIKIDGQLRHSQSSLN